MADMFQGVAAPDVNTTKTTASVAPQYYTDYLTDVASAGKTAMGRSPNEMVSPLTNMQNQGYAAVPGAATAYQPGLASAQKTAGMAAQGMSPEAIQGFMNPYTSNVVDEMGRLQQQNIQRNVMPSLKAGFVGTGGLGGQRYANAMGQTSADMQANLMGQQYGALSSGYKDALQAAYNQANLQNQVAQTQGTLAEREQTLGLTGAGAMTKAGAEQQAYNQSIIDAPLKTAANAAALMKGYTIPTTSTETFKGPMPGVYGASPLSQVAGLGALLGSGFNSKSGWGNRFLDWLGTQPSGTIGSYGPGSGTVDPSTGQPYDYAPDPGNTTGVDPDAAMTDENIYGDYP
jgi:hypothetical protein